VGYKVGDEVTLSYTEDDPTSPVDGIGEEAAASDDDSAPAANADAQAAPVDEEEEAEAE